MSPKTLEVQVYDRATQTWYEGTLTEAVGKEAPSMPSSPPTADPIEKVKSAFTTEQQELLTFTLNNAYVKIQAKQYLGSDNFAKIASVVRNINGEYVSAGKQSHFRVPLVSI